MVVSLAPGEKASGREAGDGARCVWQGEAVNPCRVMVQRSAKREVLGAGLQATGLSSILELKVIALLLLSLFESWEGCSDTH